MPSRVIDQELPRAHADASRRSFLKATAVISGLGALGLTALSAQGDNVTIFRVQKGDIKFTGQYVAVGSASSIEFSA